MGPKDKTDGYTDGFFWEHPDDDRGQGQDDYDDGYIEGSGDFLSDKERSNGNV